MHLFLLLQILLFQKETLVISMAMEGHLQGDQVVLICQLLSRKGYPCQELHFFEIVLFHGLPFLTLEENYQDYCYYYQVNFLTEVWANSYLQHTSLLPLLAQNHPPINYLVDR